MRLLFFLISLLFNVSVTAQSFDSGKMDSLFTLIEAHQQGMGSISIFKDGKEVYQNTIGFADQKQQKKADRDTRYRVGSVTKIFTAALIMKLIEQGKIKLETRLAEYFPEIPNSSQITIEHLLRHQSGIYNITDAADYQQWMTKPFTPEQLLEKMSSYQPSFNPGEKTGYSNSNYILLSFIAQDLGKKSYQNLLTEYLFKPCGLEKTSYGSKINVSRNEALSYQKLEELTLAPETDMSIPAGAGAIISTPTDLNTFMHCLFSHKVVTKESLARMMTLENALGLGLFEVPFYEKKAYGHTGGIDGFQSNVFYFPNDNVSVAYLSNGVVMPVNDILIGALSIFFNRDYEFPSFEAPLALSSEELDQYLGVYSSPDLPLKITVTKNDQKLMAQATGQSAFPLEAYEKDKFKFDQAMIKLDFFPDEGKMILKQAGQEFKYSRQ
jgi:CubicO group peptidase (beta-lactamase class C family)